MADQQDFLQPGYWRNASRPLNVYGIPAPLFLLYVMCNGPWEERDCPYCGHYRISDELILALMDSGQIFDIYKARALLESRRTEGIMPCIQIHEALLVTFERADRATVALSRT
ncbi:hypothetical protein [Pseudomonas sp. 25 R 14]|uniref:hypothetical protein n=1 Tax=Pseudomonas sp. 25 R 14 TaxID=1844109 RepID=UPI00081288CA|nr:hypothetical protein [Pseudomonas sp. 25 R 14]CRM75357.1 hypothetical protein [Pseudomonas sp. 25 R 14]